MSISDDSRASESAEGYSENRSATTKVRRSSIDDLEQFIVYAYSRKGQRVVLKPSVEKVLCQKPHLVTDARMHLLEVAKEDVLLAVPRQLLLVFRDVVGYPLLKREVRNFVREVLAQHPVFGYPALTGVLNNLPDAVGMERALSCLNTLELEAPSVSSSTKRRLKPKDLEVLRANATYTLAVWFAETRSLAVGKVNQHLYSALWRPKADAIVGETQRLGLLTEIRDIAGVGLASSTFQRQAEEQAQLASAARRSEDGAWAKARSLEADVARLRQDISEREQQVTELRGSLQNEQRDHQLTKTHFRDDLEQLRTRVLRRLKNDVTLLSEGLHALRRGKVHVMEDHAERVLDGLNIEIRNLETGELE